VYALAAATGSDFREQSIGSSAECTIILPDFAVSARHAMLSYRKNRYVLSDCRSTNGTFINARRVGPEGRILEDGDLITFGRYHFLFVLPETLHRQIRRRLQALEGE
jgi:pSer/pThr/pTyr-binding forkhead associated (FHA) protein